MSRIVKRVYTLKGTITNAMLEKWNIGISELYEVAKCNTPKLFPPSVNSMSEVINSIMMKEFAQNNSD